MSDFLDPHNLYLNKYSQEIKKTDLEDASIKSLMRDMLKIASGERDEANPDRPSLVGLSAPQLGKFLRIILVDVAANRMKTNFTPDLKFFINPKILAASVEENLDREGCYSTGEICGAVYRPNEITVSALNEKGMSFEYTSNDYFVARIIQHEIDHLNGIRFPSRVRKPEHLHIVKPDDFQNYRENWQNWNKLCPFEDWLKLYRGDDNAEV